MTVDVVRILHLVVHLDIGLVKIKSLFLYCVVYSKLIVQ